MSATNDSFTGWAATSKTAPLEQKELKLRAWDEYCIEMDITHCGICGSDEHTIKESWGPTMYPCVVGHEIVGKVTKVGKNVTHLKVGDLAGIGAQSGSCHECAPCKEGNENVCRGHSTFTYNSKWANGDMAYGGYADKWRGDSRFAFKVPDNMPGEVAATFFCGGITTYAPLKRANVNEKSVVGVMGIGGLGHYGILWAKAMGAKVVGMSHSDRKREVALELGCDDYIVTSNADDMARYKYEMTHILCTGTSPDFQWPPFLNLLRPNGRFINVSAPDWDFPAISPLLMIMNQVSIEGSAIGSPEEIRDMLDFADKHNVRPWIQKYPMKDVNKALEDFRAGKPRFRFVLEN
ncbi:MAG: chaperonin 10-like protein [Benjaminiella poitrasii]|nr:MAG: chaperonin 10-like protein [Benjaminiella poitrasii]